MTTTYHLTTLGCAKNQVDSDKLVGTLLADGLTEADDAETAEIQRLEVFAREHGLSASRLLMPAVYAWVSGTGSQPEPSTSMSRTGLTWTRAISTMNTIETSPSPIAVSRLIFQKATLPVPAPPLSRNAPLVCSVV